MERALSLSVALVGVTGSPTFFNYYGPLISDDYVAGTEECMNSVTLFQSGMRQMGNRLKTVHQKFEGWTKRGIWETNMAT